MRTLIATLLLLTATSVVADETATHRFTSSVPRGSVRRIVIDIPEGDITVRNGASDTIRVVGKVERHFDGWRRRDDNQRIVDDSSAEIYVSSSEAVVRRHFGPNADGWLARNHNTSYDLTIEVPAGMTVAFETRYGDVTLDGTFGDVDLDLRAGEIHFRSPRATVHELTASVRVGEVNANLGDETVSREGVFPGTTRFVNAHGGTSTVNLHTTAGEVHVNLLR